MGTQTQRACKLWSWWLPNAHDDRVKCYSRHRVPMSKLFGRFYCKVSGMMCCVRLRNPPVPSPYTVKETLRYANEYFKKMLSQLSTLPIYGLWKWNYSFTFWNPESSKVQKFLDNVLGAGNMLPEREMFPVQEVGPDWSKSKYTVINL